MSTRADALVEIGTEELPPKALAGLAEAFAAGVRSGLAQTRLECGALSTYATPRRLTLFIPALAACEPDHVVLRRGPALKAAFAADGSPTQAALGFARSCAVTVEQLERTETDQGGWLAYRSVETGRPAASILPQVVAEALARLPIPRRMRWGAGDAEFVRPVHWVVLLHGSDVIEAEILGVVAGRCTRGHRFHHPEPLSLPDPSAYVGALARAHVIAGFDERRQAIRDAIATQAAALGGSALYDDALLDEVTALVEWPVAVTGAFDAAFLRLPREVLVATLQGHQRYFPLAAPDDTLLPAFVTIANIDSRDLAQVRAGNERVVRPRLADAAFFWDSDCRRRLDSHLDSLRTVVYHERLGSLYDKTRRVESLALHIAERIGGDTAMAARAALLSRCDLLSAMVGEFPELQGVMGGHYARGGGEAVEVAAALDELYLPRHAGDRLPRSRTGQALAIADRIDTLVGIFGIGQAPTGDKDPFALRRAALGTLRIIIEGALELDLAALVGAAAANLGDHIRDADVEGAVLEFMRERLRSYYLEAGIAADTFEAVAARPLTHPLDFDRRLRAVEAFRRLPAAASLAAANKRIGNILRKAGQMPAAAIDAALLVEDAERDLHAALAVHEVGESLDAALAAGRTPDYTAVLTGLADLREPVDRFFDAVLVMCEDPAIRGNRLALLEHLHRQFLHVADIARLQS
ncbi:MAG: glycine--tRNA ligase subunit beta [Gammaproteobacteria bacterium]|nr:glycine--tRNA ligase subunit beta [Gammaproteobacteria bacterium]